MTIASIFTDFSSDCCDTELPLKNHSHIPLIIDILSRYERHHIALKSRQSDKIHRALLRALAYHFHTEPLPTPLKECRLIHVKEKNIDTFKTEIASLKNSSQRLVIAIDFTDFLTLNALAEELVTWDELRWIIFISEKNQLKKIKDEHRFTVTHFQEPHVDELLAILKTHRTALEQFHQTTISDEIIANAFHMANHYLPGDSSLDKTFELLDSAAARASIVDHPENSKKQPFVLTSHFLRQVISHQTGIPLADLHNNQFQVSKFIDTVRKHIFGQDAAISMIASLLQNACIQLQESPGSLCHFLFVGPQDVGKTNMAYAISEHLFSRREALLHVNLNHLHYTSLTDIKIFPRSDKNPEMNLLSAIQETPYAIVLIENIDEVSKETFYLIKGIFDQGYLVDEHHNKYDFRHAIIIATTRIGSDQIHRSTGEPHVHEAKPIDLMQLVLNEQVQNSFHHTTEQLSPQELCDELMPTLVEHFPLPLLQKFNIIPFVPLDYAACEKIIRSKIKTLARRVQSSFGIELNFAPEVIKFLAHEALWRKTHIKSLDNLLEQHLYSTVTHEIVLNAENNNRSKRLLIQLNDSGQRLRCEFMTSNEAAFYNV